MTDIRNEIELVTPGLNLLEDHGEGAKSVIERTKKILHEAADRIEELEEALHLAHAALSGANMNMNVVEKKIRSALREGK
tara:strand:+ start:227 stop:466 length:240 start_codon:yes stop_codon:yes gene_type:complete